MHKKHLLEQTNNRVIIGMCFGRFDMTKAAKIYLVVLIWVSALVQLVVLMV